MRSSEQMPRRIARRLGVRTVVLLACSFSVSCRAGAGPEYLGPHDDHWAYFGVSNADVQSFYSQRSWQDTGPLRELLRSHVPYDSVALTHHGCTGGECPEYQITLRKSGTATFEGEWSVPMEGLWSGELDIDAFARICHAFDLLPPDAPVDSTGPDGGYTLVFWPSGGAPARTRSGLYGEGPTGAWVLRGAIDGLVLQVKWARAATAEGGE